MIFSSITLLLIVKIILKDRKDYFEWRNNYEIKRIYNHSNSL